jgi:anthranilate phosphoribosyltransferase
MGSKRAYIVFGMDSLDEISIAGPTKVSEVAEGTVTTYLITPEDFGLQRAPLSTILGGTPTDNAVMIRNVLDGEKGPCRDVVTLNAAFALAASGCAATPKEGLVMAEQSIDSGAARKKLLELAAFTTEHRIVE